MPGRRTDSFFFLASFSASRPLFRLSRPSASQSIGSRLSSRSAACRAISVGQRRPVLVGQHDQAHAVVGEQAGVGREAVDPPAVVDATVAAIGVGHPAQWRTRRARSPSWPTAGRWSSAACAARRAPAGLMIVLPSSLPPWVCTATHRAISATLELIEPAGPTVVMSRNGMTRTLPSCSS